MTMQINGMQAKAIAQPFSQRVPLASRTAARVKQDDGLAVSSGTYIGSDFGHDDLPVANFAMLEAARLTGPPVVNDFDSAFERCQCGLNPCTLVRRDHCAKNFEEARLLHTGEDVLPAVGLQQGRSDGLFLLG